MPNTRGTYFFLAFMLLGATAFTAFWLGHYPLSFDQYTAVFKEWLGIAHASDIQSLKQTQTILLDLRFPRIAAAIIIGAALSVSGAVFQGIFVNPLVSPGILGVLSGASFGAALGMVLRQPFWIVQISAFAFGFLAVFTALFIAKLYGKGQTILMLILGGVISSSIFGAFVSLLKYVADPYDTLPSIVYWMMGSLSAVQLDEIQSIALIMFISIITVVLFSKHLNVMSLGEEDAKSLGVDVEKVRILLIFFATLLSALSVMLAGIIGWIGLVIPHIARFLVGANHQVLLPFSALVGAIFLLIVDTISRTAFAVEVPLGILTSLVGIPVFIWVLRNRGKIR